jgi:hypothetical protein
MLLFHKTPGEIMDLPKGERAFVFATVMKSPELLGQKKRQRRIRR